MDKGKMARGTWKKFSSDEKARVAKHTAEHGVLSTVRNFAKIWPDHPLKERTVRGWKNRYNCEVFMLKRSGKEIVVRELVDQKRGGPLLLGEELDKQVQAYLSELRANGGPVNTAIAIATAREIVKNADSNLLKENGGHINLTKDWAKYLLHRMNYVKRRGCLTAKVTVENFVQIKTQFLFDIQSLVEIEEIRNPKFLNY